MINEKKKKTVKKYTFSKIKIYFIYKFKKTSELFRKNLISSHCSSSIMIQHGIKSCPIWGCEPSKFQWYDDDKEICLLLKVKRKLVPKTETYT